MGFTFNEYQAYIDKDGFHSQYGFGLAKFKLGDVVRIKMDSNCCHYKSNGVIVTVGDSFYGWGYEVDFIQDYVRGYRVWEYDIEEAKDGKSH